jgi:hypothetical protein
MSFFPLSIYSAEDMLAFKLSYIKHKLAKVNRALLTLKREKKELQAELVKLEEKLHADKD